MIRRIACALLAPILLALAPATRADYLVPVSSWRLPPILGAGTSFNVANLASDGTDLYLQGRYEFGPGTGDGSASWAVARFGAGGDLLGVVGTYERSDGIAHHGGHLYLGSTVGDWSSTTLQGVWELDPSTGAILGDMLPAPAPGSNRFDMTSDGTNLYALTTGFDIPHEIHRVDPDDFSVLSSVTIDPPGTFGMPLQGFDWHGGYFYVTMPGRAVGKFDPAGTLIQTYEIHTLTGFGGVGGIAFVGDRAFINTRDGYITEYAFSDVPYDPPVVPEPGTLAMGLMGMMVMGAGMFIRRRARTGAGRSNIPSTPIP